VGRKFDSAIKAAGAQEQPRAANNRKEEFLEMEAFKRHATYSDMLSNLGLSPTQIKTVEDKLQVLHRVAMPVGETLIALKVARLEYDRDMRALLGEMKYQQYRAYEELKPYRREAEGVQQRTAAGGFLMDEAQERLVVGLLSKAGLQTLESWDGPYDPLPRPLVGTEAILEDKARLLERIRDGLAAITASDAWRELPPQVTQATLAYFEDRVSAVNRGIEILKLSPENRRKHAEEGERKLLEQSP